MGIGDAQDGRATSPCPGASQSGSKHESRFVNENDVSVPTPCPIQNCTLHGSPGIGGHMLPIGNVARFRWPLHIAAAPFSEQRRFLSSRATESTAIIPSGRKQK